MIKKRRIVNHRRRTFLGRVVRGVWMLPHRSDTSQGHLHPPLAISLSSSLFSLSFFLAWRYSLCFLLFLSFHTRGLSHSSQRCLFRYFSYTRMRISIHPPLLHPLCDVNLPTQRNGHCLHVKSQLHQHTLKNIYFSFCCLHIQDSIAMRGKHS